VQFEALYRKLMHIAAVASANGAPPMMQRRGELLYLLQEMQGAATDGGARVQQKGLAANFISAHHTANVIAPLPPARTSQPQQPLDDAASRANDSTSSTSGVAAAEMMLAHSSVNITESELLRDILYTLLGGDGNYIKFHHGSDAFLVLPSVQISRPMRLLVQRISELGWLYKKIQNYIRGIIESGDAQRPATSAAAAAAKSSGALTSRDGKKTTEVPPPVHAYSGKIEQSFAATLRDELNDYMRLIT
jgi:hypothetical protein